MAKGDVIVFDQFYKNEGDGKHNLSNGASVKCALVTNAVVPSRTTPDPRWGTGGTTNFSAQEVTPGGNYIAGGAALTNTFNKDNGTSTLRGNNLQWLADAANPQNASYLIAYDDVSAGKECLYAVDLGGVLDMRAGPLNINWNAAGILVKGASAGPV